MASGKTASLCFVAILFTAASVSAQAPENTARLVLPEVIYAVSGIEANVYFDNVVLVLNPAAYAFDVTCAKGVQQAERWTFTPAPQDAGTYPFTLDLRNEANEVIARAQSQLVVADADAGAGRTVSALLIGDSLTNASVYSQHLLDCCAGAGNPVLTLVGSHLAGETSETNRHEGFGGWTAKMFATRYTGVARTGDYKERGSPFLYKDGDEPPKLDFKRYCADVNGGNAPDFVTIFLGCNDTFSATDESIEATIDDMFQHLDALLATILDATETTRVGLLPPVPPAATQDAFAVNYACGQTRWQYKRNQHRVVERMLERYGNREAERIVLVPAFTNLDCVHNFPSATAPWNARTELDGARLNNGVHPSPEGYRQIGDALYGWLKAQLAQP